MKTKVIVTKNEDSCEMQIGKFKIVASNPRIRPFNSYKYSNEKDIMHFYYSLDIYQMDKKEWEKVAHTRVFEFGIMPYVPEFLQKVLDFDVRTKGCNYVNVLPVWKKTFSKVYPFSVAGLLSEDRLEIQKKLFVADAGGSNTEIELYDVNFFIGGDECGVNAYGVHVDNLSRENIGEMMEFYKGFMEIANRKAKEDVEALLNDESDSESNYPKIIREYLKSEYGIDDWRPIFMRLSVSCYILQEFSEYIYGTLSVSELRCCGEKTKRHIQDLLKKTEDYQAYMLLADEYGGR